MSFHTTCYKVHGQFWNLNCKNECSYNRQGVYSLNTNYDLNYMINRSAKRLLIVPGPFTSSQLNNFFDMSLRSDFYAFLKKDTFTEVLLMVFCQSLMSVICKLMRCQFQILFRQQTLQKSSKIPSLSKRHCDQFSAEKQDFKKSMTARHYLAVFKIIQQYFAIFSCNYKYLRVFKSIQQYLAVFNSIHQYLTVFSKIQQHFEECYPHHHHHQSNSQDRESITRGQKPF